jgi:oxygen-independent coproporphyrinogen III oxidase
VIEDLRAAGDWAARMGLDCRAGGHGLPGRRDAEPAGAGAAGAAVWAMRAEFDFEPDAEITVECAPGQIADETLESLVRAGVNRVSLGVQSFIDREAHESGRLHSRAVVEEDLRRLRAAGIGNLSVDLIAGWPGRRLLRGRSRFGADRERRAACQRLHAGGGRGLAAGAGDAGGWRALSRGAGADGRCDCADVYAGDRETDGGGAGAVRDFEFLPAGFRVAAQSALLAAAALSGSGAGCFFDAAGGGGFRECRFVLRATTADDLGAYLEGSKALETSWLSPERQHEEAWFLGLRLNAGVDVAAVERVWRGDVARAMEVVGRLAEDGLLDSDGKTVRLTERGRMLSNDVFQEFLGAETEESVRRIG